MCINTCPRVSIHTACMQHSRGFTHAHTHTHTFWGVAGYIVLESKFIVYIHILTRIRASMGAYMHVCIYTHIHICIHIYNACTYVYTVYTCKHMHVCKHAGSILGFLTAFNESWPPWIKKATPYESRSINFNQPTIQIGSSRFSLRNQHWQIFLTAINGSWPPHKQKPPYTNGIQSILATLQSKSGKANLPCVFGRFSLKYAFDECGAIRYGVFHVFDYPSSNLMPIFLAYLVTVDFHLSMHLMSVEPSDMESYMYLITPHQI